MSRMQMRIVVGLLVTASAVLAQTNTPQKQFPIGCELPVLVDKKELVIGQREFQTAFTVHDNGLAALLDAGTAETDVIVDPTGKTGNPGNSNIYDPFFLYSPIDASSIVLNTTLSANLWAWKWKAATCSGSNLATILPRQMTLTMQLNAQYGVAILIHLRYEFKKIDEQKYSASVDVSLAKGCKEIALQPFEFHGANGAAQYPGPTLGGYGLSIPRPGLGGGLGCCGRAIIILVHFEGSHSVSGGRAWLTSS